MLLGMLFDQGTYAKLYSYRHLINGFAVDISAEQVTPSVCDSHSSKIVRSVKLIVIVHN